MTAATPETIRAALACVPADDHDLWLRSGMAVHSEYPGEDGFAMWDAWSQGSDRYNARAARDTWRSFKPGKVTIATLWHEAKARGYRRPKTPADRPQAPAAPPQAAPAAAPAVTEADAARQHAHDAAAQRANELWEKASKTPAAPYLAHKGVKSMGTRALPDGALLVPMRAGPTEMAPLVNLQIIRPAKAGGFEKRFLRGGRMAGTMFVIGGFPLRGDCIVIAEGLATAASVVEATGLHVAVAWNAGNLHPVAMALRAAYPDKRLLIAGDDDRTTKGNPGRTKAEAAARAAGGAAVFPHGLPDGAKDWNDLHQCAGLDAVSAQIEAAIQAAQATESTAPLQTPPEAQKEAAGADSSGRMAAAVGDGAKPKSKPRSAQRDAPKSDAAHDAFRFEDGALWFYPPDDGSGGAARPVRVCGELRVTALARDAHDGGAALLLEFDTPFGPKIWLMPLAMLAGDGTAYRAELLSRGFMVPTDAKRRALLTAYLQSRKPADLVRIVDRVGWHGRAYVTPRETIGDDGGERILFQSEAPTEGTFSQRGTADQWRERIGRLCVGNSRLMLFVSLALAGPLLMWAKGTDGGIFHLVGDSSCGKTTVLRVGASIYGGREFTKNWRATSNGTEGVAAQHSDAVLFLDESGQMEGREIGEVAYMLANGQGKIRSSRTGAARPSQTWRLLVGSTGEIGIAESMSEANKRTRAGQELRMIDQPADAGAGMGTFEERHEFESPGALAQHLARATESTYGTVGRAWIEWLTENTDGLQRKLRESMDAIEARLVPELASGQVQRVGRRFALVAAAGEMATEVGLTGWPAGAATAAAHRCLNAWIEARPGGIGMGETAQMLRQLRAWFGLHGEARFVDWARADDDHAPKTMNRAGWRRPIKTTTGLELLTGWEWFVLPDVFRTEACKGFNERAALRLLAERGHLHRESPKGFGCRASPPGADKVNVYRIKSSILSEGEE